MIGRIYFVNPQNLELYYLRVLLLKVRGATSFEYLRTVNGTVCETFQSTAFKLGLLHEDEEWEICLKEAESEKVST